MTEEFGPDTRSVELDRLAPSSVYSLRVVAVYLDRYRRVSDRVHFNSPTDNESRRFKENTYRPIHRYPDERRELRVGLSQVRGEELMIVCIAVLFWLATICLFFNKWGKIRMLEPYQPAYRDTSAPFVHPQSSLCNLHNSSATGSGTGNGALTAMGAQMSSFCAQPTIMNPLLVEPASGKLAARQSNEGDELGAILVKRKPSKSLLLTAKHSTASQEELLVQPVMERAEHQLNYLWQSKAQALAKAANLWSKHQQQQQPSKQQQLSFGWSSAAERAQQLAEELEATRAQLRHLAAAGHTQRAPLLGQKSLELRRATLFAPRLLAEQQQQHLVDLSLATNRDRLMRYYQSSRASEAQLMLAGNNQSRSLERAEQVSCSRDSLTDGGQVRSASKSSSNKLRRLLFINKTHRHQHIATSTSSSTLVQQNSRQAGQLEVASQESARLNSSSLDTELKQLDKEQNCGESSKSSSSLPTCMSSAQANLKRKHQPEPRLIQHHILIEPPSPPNQYEQLLSAHLIGQSTPEVIQVSTSGSNDEHCELPDCDCDCQDLERRAASACAISSASNEHHQQHQLGMSQPASIGEPSDRCRQVDAFAKLAANFPCRHRHRRQPGSHQSFFSASGEAQKAPPTSEQAEAEPELPASPSRARVSSVFVASNHSRVHRDSFAMLRALSQKKSKSAEDVAYLSSLVLKIWTRDGNPLLQSVSQQQLSQTQPSARRKSSTANLRQLVRPRTKPKSSLTDAHL